MKNQPAAPGSLPTAVVIGGCGGLGFECAAGLAKTHHVVLADINREDGEVFVDRLRSAGLSAEFMECDVTQDQSIDDTLNKSARVQGSISTLVNVVGLSPSSGDGRRILQVNLAGAMRVAQSALPHLRSGVGVFISSMSAHVAGRLPELHPIFDTSSPQEITTSIEHHYGGVLTPVDSYRVSKYGLNRMCRRLAPAWGETGNRIVSLSPGMILAPMGARERAASGGGRKSALLAKTPLKREGEMHEIVDVVGFLVGPAASFITGIDVLVDGGITAAVEFSDPD